MKTIWLLLFTLLLPACKETPSQPQQPKSHIAAYVHWDNQALAGKKIELVQTGETKLTDSTGLAEFSVPAGKYIIRAYDINRGGPGLRRIDFDVEVHSGESRLSLHQQDLACSVEVSGSHPHEVDARGNAHAMRVSSIPFDRVISRRFFLIDKRCHLPSQYIVHID